MSERDITLTDCGTSRSGVAVFVADETSATAYPVAAPTVTVSRRPATSRVTRIAPSAPLATLMSRVTSTKFSAATRIV